MIIYGRIGGEIVVPSHGREQLCRSEYEWTTGTRSNGDGS